MRQVSEKEVKKRLQFDNPWWQSNEIGTAYQEFPVRSYLEIFYTLLSEMKVNRAVVLMGPRRVGKTVMIHQTIQRLISVGTASNRILYLSLDTPVYTDLSLERLTQIFQNEFQHNRDTTLFIFFDEIQYLKNWEVHLKSLVDSYPNYRFIASGSAAAALKLKSQESGAGRFTDFMLPPLTFAEYLRFVDLERKLIIETINKETDKPKYSTSDPKLLNSEFINYLNYGGYPEAVFAPQIQADPSRYIKSDIIDKVLLRDLPSLYGIHDIQELNRLFTTLAYNTGNEVSLEDLSQSSGVAKNTIRRYLEYLEAAFLIRRITRIDQNVKRFKRATTFKVYLTNASMRSALFGPVDSDHESMGSLTETAIFGQWLHSDFIDNIFYARWKTGEVDMVAMSSDKKKPIWAVEVKWTDRYFNDPRSLKALIQFVQLNKIKISPLVTTLTESGEKTVDDIVIDYNPTSLYCYMVGQNVVNQKTKMLQQTNGQVLQT